MSPLRPLLLLLPLCVGPLFGCSTRLDASLVTAGDSGALEDTQGAGSALQLTVYPPDQSADFPERLLPQSFEVQPNLDETLVLAAPIVVQGGVSAYVATPWAASAATPPGEQGPVAHAEIGFHPPTGEARTTATDEDGSFAIELSPSPGYRFTVRSDDPTVPPWSERLDLDQSTGIDLDMGIGHAIWGWVLDDEGDPIAGAALQAEDPDGLRSGVAMSDEAGFYVLYVQEGHWQISCLGRDDRRDPVLTQPSVRVDEWGAEINIQYANLEQISVGGRVENEEGDGVADVTVRFRAQALDGYEDTTSHLEVEARTNEDGNYDSRLVPGVYDIEYIPDEDVLLTPATLSNQRIDEQLDQIVLDPYVAMNGQVVDTRGYPVGGAIITLQETAYEGRSWTVYSEEDGTFLTSVPGEELELSISPPADRPGLALTRIVLDSMNNSSPVLAMETGDELAGTVSFGSSEGLLPIPFAWVEVRDDSGALWAAGITDEAGRYTVRVAR